MRKFLLLSIFSLLFVFSSDAQIRKTLHKTYSIDEVSNLSLDIIGEYEVVLWAGSAIMTVTTIELYDANLNIFKFFLKQGRYDIDMTIDEDSAAFVSHDKERRTITKNDKECWEIVKTTIHIPDDFEIIDQTKMVRKKKEPTSSQNTN